jgi:hypothetical protein
LALDSFSGRLQGVAAKAGVFTFSVRVRDYSETAPGVTREFHLEVGGTPP